MRLHDVLDIEMRSNGEIRPVLPAGTLDSVVPLPRNRALAFSTR